MVISPCSASKDDSVPIPKGSRVVNPSDYLNSQNLIFQLTNIRQGIFQNPRASVGVRITYAFDLYVNAGNAYKNLRACNYLKLKAMLLSNEIEWFFLSGGYGIIHASEEARKYQATFNANIARQKNIPLTGNLWSNVLPSICDDIVSKFNPRWIYVFGGRDYTKFIKQTNFWKIRVNVKMFESTGRPGPHWLSPRLNALADAIVAKNLGMFNQIYPQRFYKQ